MDQASEIVKDSIRRFKHLPNRTIARYILHEYGEFFDGNLDAIRSRIRYYIGSHGKKKRDQVERNNTLIEKDVVSIPKTWNRDIPDYLIKDGVWLILADIHIPFHEKKPIEAAIQYAKDHNVTGVYLNGDTFDFDSVKFWRPDRRPNFDKELEMAIDFLDFLEQEFPDCRIVFKVGNHEYRLPSLVQSKVPELMGLPLAAFDVVFSWEQRGIDIVEHHQKARFGKLPVIHGHEIRSISTAVNPARGLILKTKSWALTSHFHQESSHTDKNIQGQYLTTWSTGCLCNLTPDYNPMGNAWCWGFATIEVGKNGDFEVINKRILPNGKVV